MQILLYLSTGPKRADTGRLVTRGKMNIMSWKIYQIVDLDEFYVCDLLRASQGWEIPGRADWKIFFGPAPVEIWILLKIFWKFFWFFAKNVEFSTPGDN